MTLIYKRYIEDDMWCRRLSLSNQDCNFLAGYAGYIVKRQLYKSRCRYLIIDNRGVVKWIGMIRRQCIFIGKRLTKLFCWTYNGIKGKIAIAATKIWSWEKQHLHRLLPELLTIGNSPNLVSGTVKQFRKCSKPQSVRYHSFSGRYLICSPLRNARSIWSWHSR